MDFIILKAEKKLKIDNQKGEQLQGSMKIKPEIFFPSLVEATKE